MIAPRKILAIKLRALGDTVLMTAALQELRRAYPNAEIHVVATNTWASLLEKNPAIDRVWLYERHKSATARARNVAKLALNLRKEKFDVVVNFHASPSSSALAFAVGAKVRAIHFHGHHDKNRYSTVVIPGKGELKPIIERDMDAVRALGVSVPEGRLPRIFLDPREIDESLLRIRRMGISGPLLCLGIGASRPTKVWPLDRFATMAIRWCEEMKGSVIVFNSRQETDLARAFYTAIDEKLVTWYKDRDARMAIRARILNETEIPLRQMSAIMMKAVAYLGNDSGPKHIAVASGLPTVTLFGPEDPFEWHPYPRALHPLLFVEGLKCRKDNLPGYRPWCGLNVCTIEEHRCMKLLSEDDAYHTLRTLADRMLAERGAIPPV